MPNRTLDQILLCGIYLASKLVNISQNSQLTFVELVMTLNSNTGGTDQDLMTHVVLELSGGEKREFYKLFTKNSENPENRKNSGNTEKVKILKFDSDRITGDLPTFYNKIFVPVMNDWIQGHRKDAVSQKKYNSLFPSEFQKAQTVLLLSPKTVRMPNNRGFKNELNNQINKLNSTRWFLKVLF